MIDLREPSSEPLTVSGESALVRHAIGIIKDTYGDTVSVNYKNKDLFKFGTCNNIGVTRGTIWFTGQDEINEIFVADNVNSIDSISSNDINDTEVVVIEGHTMSGGDLTFVTQKVTLNGRNRVALSTPLNRGNREAHNQESAIDLVGEIYLYENTPISNGKPIDTTKIHVTIPAGENTSFKASTAISSTDYWIVTSFSGGSLTKSGSNVNDIRLEVRPIGGVFKPVKQSLPFGTSESDKFNFKPYLIIPKNSDVRLTSISSASGQEITGGIHGFLATII